MFHVLKIPVGFGRVMQSWYTSLNIKFGVNRTFYVPKTPVYRFDLYVRYRSLWTDDDKFQEFYFELVYKPKCQIFCESDFPCAHDPGIPVWFIWEVPDLLQRYSPFSIQTGRSDAIVITTVGQTDIAQMSQNFALIKYLQGTQFLRSIFLCVPHVLTKLIYAL